MPNGSPVVAIFNASDDTVEMIEQELQYEGFLTVNGHVADIKRGTFDFVAFIAQHDPQAIVWDISPPYEQNWNFFQLLRSSDALKGRGIVVTTTHRDHLNDMAGKDTGAIEILGKPYDLAQIVEAVKAAVARFGAPSGAPGDTPARPG